VLKKLKGLKKLVVWIKNRIFWTVPSLLIYYSIKPADDLVDLGSFFLCSLFAAFTGLVRVFYIKYKQKNSPSGKGNLQLKFFTYIVPKKYRDEFLGDFLEQRLKMKEERQPNWFINLVSIGQIFFVVVAMLKIRLWDWIDPEKEKNK